ncbi:sigma-70 family RNA polymerase sigma factor [Trinickia fusca]|uniref:Sigma-70 family RNA polymerase sigma factor n=1 Tax=Trinickia fusca TaxID=2419777 RepID=A0A494XII2_9BURK|nr:sigma-70 family RNA polymerase sigma factor [Trinickia fusca]RKP48426.1 sigma-70 family RNA polymerase sigma factor [Trinickia fusca]
MTRTPGSETVASPDVGDEAVLAHWWRTRGQLDDEAHTAREQLITHYQPLARIIAGKLYAGRTHNEIDFDEYLQLATVGLIEAVDRFEAERGVQFKTFATIRMRGAILNGLERLTEKQQQIAWQQRLRADRAQALADGKVPDDLDALFGMLAEAGVALALGMLLEGSGMIDEPQPEGHPEQSGYFAHVELRQLRERLRTLVAELPKQERAVIWLHYIQDTPFAEIALELDVSRARVAQIHRKALISLRTLCNALRSCDVAW